MIEITSIIGEEFVLNCDLIYKIEKSADTLITLTDGKTIRVCESPKDVTDKVIAFRRKILGMEEGEKP